MIRSWPIRLPARIRRTHDGEPTDSRPPEADLQSDVPTAHPDERPFPGHHRTAEIRALPAANAAPVFQPWAPVQRSPPMPATDGWGLPGEASPMEPEPARRLKRVPGLADPDVSDYAIPWWDDSLPLAVPLAGDGGLPALLAAPRRTWPASEQRVHQARHHASAAADDSEATRPLLPSREPRSLRTPWILLWAQCLLVGLVLCLMLLLSACRPEVHAASCFMAAATSTSTSTGAGA